LRREGPTHQVATLLHTWLAQVQQDIRNYSQLSPAEALRNPTLAALRTTWDAEFSPLGIPWASVQPCLVAGVLPITIQAVNQRTGFRRCRFVSTARFRSASDNPRIIEKIPAKCSRESHVSGQSLAGLPLTCDNLHLPKQLTDTRSAYRKSLFVP
jgi:hypothetical protein